MGDVQKTPVFDSSNHLQLNYEYGAICKKGQQKEHIRTTITFICDLEAEVSILSMDLLFKDSGYKKLYVVIIIITLLGYTSRGNRN